MPIKKQWRPPPEGIHFCPDFANIAERGTFGARTTYFAVSCSSMEGNRRMRLWKYCTCVTHFRNFRILMPYPRPPQKKRQRIPTPDDAPFLLCAHLESTDIHITWGSNGTRIHSSKNYLVFVFTGTYHMKSKAVRHWLFVACLDCHMMYRALIERPMPLSYGYENPIGADMNDVRWSNRSYGLFWPPWPPAGTRSVKWCRECMVPTTHIDGSCMNTMHAENTDMLGPVRRIHCDKCNMTTEHSQDGQCLRCDKGDILSGYGTSFGGNTT